MTHPASISELWPGRLDEIIESFEARQAMGGADLSDFLPSPNSRQYADVALELMRVDLEHSWRRGQRKRLHDYRERFRDVLDDPDRLAQLAFEEYRLRCGAGELVDPAEYRAQYAIDTDGWPRSVGEGVSQNAIETLDAIDALGGEPQRLIDAIQMFPEVGGSFAGFRLLEQIGQGTFGRVFLARQSDLAERMVVLKITAGGSLEPDRLARLQHTHIVPIYSLHREGSLQAICMPFFGRATLAHVLARLSSGGIASATAAVFGETIQAGADNTASFHSSPPTDRGQPDRRARRRWLRRAVKPQNYERAFLEVAVRVAEALMHAHRHKILHLDLKPANILLADDGRPMLLDFNISGDLVPGGRSSLLVGGTLPYMAPEHLAALETGIAIDQRADIYSLGVVLYEMLTGRHPFIRGTRASRATTHDGPVASGSTPARPSDGSWDAAELRDANSPVARAIAQRRHVPPNPRQINPRISPAIAALIARCLQPDVEHRYHSMDQVYQDLQRHLNDQPLLHVRNPSLAERVAKWWRRHPRLASRTTASIVAGILLIAALVAFAWHRSELRYMQDEATLARMEHALPIARVQLAAPETDTVSFHEGLQMAREMVHQLTADPRRGELPAHLSSQQRQRWRDAAAEWLYLLASAQLRHAHGEASTPQAGDYLRQAADLNHRAASLFPSDQIPAAIRNQARRIHVLQHHPQTAWQDIVEPYAETTYEPGDSPLDALESIRQGAYQQAIPLWEQLRAKRPFDSSVWLLLANAYAGAGRLSEAESCLTVCITLWPDSYLAYFHRGLCRLEQSTWREAEADFDRVLELRPDFPPALVNRALARKEQNKLDAAQQDLSQALACGTTETRIYFLRARIRKQMGDTAGYEADLEEGLRRRPQDEKSWIARGLAQLKTDPHAALLDFQQALRLNPVSRSAMRNIAHVYAERLHQPDQALAILDRLVHVDARAEDHVSRGVLLARKGERDAALAEARQALARSQEAKILFQVGCIHALCASQSPTDADSAIQMIARALIEDPRWLVVAANDPDLESIRQKSEFQALLDAASLVQQATK